MEDLLTTLGQIGSIGTAIGTLALVVLFWKTIRQLEEQVKLTRIQANYRYRPWVGPFGGIEFVKTADNLDQFAITVKNYAEIPATNVTAKFAMKKELPTKDMVKSQDMKSFSLGPLLPNMTKRYWFFIESELVRKAKAGDGKVHIILYFSYEHHGGNNGYGLISQLDTSGNFIHSDMWID